MLEDYERSLPARIILFCSHHYWKIFTLSLVLLFAISCHRLFPFLTNPVVVKAVTAEEVVVFRYHYNSKYYGRQSEDIKAPLVKFEYEGKHYQVVGGTDEGKGAGIETKVIFNKLAPQNAAEYTFQGLLDFPIFYIAFRIWLILSAFFFGLVTLDKHFAIFALNIKTLTPVRGVVFAFLLLLIPFLKHGRTLLLGNKTEGIITDEVIFADDGKMHRAVAYQAAGKEYKFPAEGDYNDEKDMIGRTVPVLYNVVNKEQACINDMKTIYVNNWLVLTGMGLVFLTGWFFATRIPNDEGTMDE